MKKFIAVVAVALSSAIVLPSCKKDYVCTCTIQGAGTTSVTMTNMIKRDAKLACESSSVAGISTCTLD